MSSPAQGTGLQQATSSVQTTSSEQEGVGSMKDRVKGHTKSLTHGVRDGAHEVKEGARGLALRFSEHLKALQPHRRDDRYSWSVLVVLGGEDSTTAPTITCSDPRVDTEPLKATAIKLDVFAGHIFWRFDLSTTALKNQRNMEYSLSCCPDKKFKFYIAGYDQKWRWGFHSCNGFHVPAAEKKYGGIKKLWKDVLQNHTPKNPLHIMMGGGDQLYNDSVMEIPTMEKWKEMDNMEERLTMDFSSLMEDEVSWKYFSNYMNHWVTPMFKDTMASVPQGSNTAALMLDSRSKRKRSEVVKPKTWEMIQEKLQALPDTVLFKAQTGDDTGGKTLPGVYQNTGCFTVGGVARAGCGQSIASKFLSCAGVNDFYGLFDEPEILDDLINHWSADEHEAEKCATLQMRQEDDLIDHWSADEHEAEKLKMVQMLQEVSKRQAMRVTFLSGDVHAAAAGKFSSVQPTEISKDHRYMLQVISSAIGNEPPPKMAVMVLNNSTASANIDEGSGRHKGRIQEVDITAPYLDLVSADQVAHVSDIALVDKTETDRKNQEFFSKEDDTSDGGDVQVLDDGVGPPVVPAGRLASSVHASELPPVDDSLPLSLHPLYPVPHLPPPAPTSLLTPPSLSQVSNRTVNEGGVPPVDTSLPTALGPCLRFAGYDPDTYAYSATALVVLNKDDHSTPKLTMQIPEKESQELTGEKIDDFEGYSFWRFKLNLMAGVHQQRVQYEVSCCKGKKFAFYVPASDERWKWGFHSCNGFHDLVAKEKYGGIQPLWKDVLACHSAEDPLHVMVGGGDQLYNDNVFEISTIEELLARSPYHVMVGGGDQLYNNNVYEISTVEEADPLHAMVGGGDQLNNDNVFEISTIEEWLRVKPIPDRLAKEFDPAMDEQVKWLYFDNYVKHWSEDKFSDAMASVPQVMMWDDHDIFDGWGSYKPAVQSCPVFQGIFAHARRFYCLFQQHARPEDMFKDNNVFSEKNWSWLGHFGSNTAALVLDTRSERTREEIMAKKSWEKVKSRLMELPTSSFKQNRFDPQKTNHAGHDQYVVLTKKSWEMVLTKKSWEMVKSKLMELPSTVRHVAVVATVPLIYPKVKILEQFVDYMAGSGGYQNTVKTLLDKTGLGNSFFGLFDDAEIVDDLIDHWSSEEHKDEKCAMLQMLQEVAKTKSIRFTFVSGDVHAAAAGVFKSSEHVEEALDHRYMLQVTSSAIGNEPLPSMVTSSAIGNEPPPSMVINILNKSAKSCKIDDHTTEEPLKLFHKQTLMIKGERNWCLVKESDSSDYASLNFQKGPMKLLQQTSPEINGARKCGVVRESGASDYASLNLQFRVEGSGNHCEGEFRANMHRATSPALCILTALLHPSNFVDTSAEERDSIRSVA
eukprot:gene31952-33736_t